MTLDTDELYRLTVTAITSAHDNDPDTAAEALTRIGNEGGPQATYKACCAFAEVATQALTKMFGGTPSAAAGDMWALQHLVPDKEVDPAEQFAMRFIVAYANNDPDQTSALFNATMSATIEEHMDSVITLLTTSTSMNRSTLDGKAGR